jgi:HD superfamily phosphohydrolase YqeK
MNKTKMIVFLADKIDPLRKYPELKRLTNESFNDLNQAFKDYLQILNTFLASKKQVNVYFTKIYEHYFSNN